MSAPVFILGGYQSDFAKVWSRQGQDLSDMTREATLGALQGRELSLKNIRTVLGTVAQAAGTGAAQNPLGSVDAEALLNNAVAGMDDALIKAVEANRVALQQFVDKGVDLRETQLKKALADMDKFEDALLGTLKKNAAAVGDPMAGPWASVLEKLNLSGTQTGLKASGATEQLTAQMEQMQSAMRATRAASLKAAQTLAESYTALVSGVLIGMSDALRQAAVPAKKSAKK
jgi:hypothetical protein